LVEVYVFEEDIDHSGFDDPPAPKTAAPVEAAAWDHRLTEPLPGRIDHADATVDLVRLEGIFNMPLEAASRSRFLADIFRVLRPGGRLVVHALAGDRPYAGAPALPGLASLVRHVPVDAEIRAALYQAGFRDMFFHQLGDIHCFQLNGVEL